MLKIFARSKVDIPLSRIQKLFSRGSGNGGQNLHASHSRCMIKFDVYDADWIPDNVKEQLLVQNGDIISSAGKLVIVREDARSPTDNEKLALNELRSRLNKAEQAAIDKAIRGEEVDYKTQRESIESTKTEEQVAIYKKRVLEEKRKRSSVKSLRREKIYFNE